MQTPPAEIGMSLEEIDTPALIVDLGAFERNLAKMAEVAASAGVRLRPHAKTHKSCAIASRQIALGAAGQCVQKVGEAEALALGGIRNILVSNEVVGESKLRRLAKLAEGSTIALCFDDAAQVDAAARAAAEGGVVLGGLVEIEVGMERCGIAPGEQARDLARRIADSAHLRFDGLQAYHGPAQHLATAAERRRAIDGAIEGVGHGLAHPARAGDLERGHAPSRSEWGSTHPREGQRARQERERRAVKARFAIIVQGLLRSLPPERSARGTHVVWRRTTAGS